MTEEQLYKNFIHDIARESELAEMCEVFNSYWREIAGIGFGVLPSEDQQRVLLGATVVLHAIRDICVRQILVLDEISNRLSERDARPN